MAGYIYISGAFETVVRNGCAITDDFIDNDPHFYEEPPTWGICRSDIRSNRNVGDYVFFVLPAHPKNLPQMIYGYMKIDRKITHLQAYQDITLKSKRMSDRKINGNIIVDEQGDYNNYDGQVHRYDFDRIRECYMVGDINNYEFLTHSKIKKLSPDFLNILNLVFGTKITTKPVDVISRKGRTLTDDQVTQLLNWLK